MIKKRISVSFGGTLKLCPNDPKCFEFLKVDVGYEMDLLPRDNIKEKYKEAWAIVTEEFTEAFSDLKKTLKDTRGE